MLHKQKPKGADLSAYFKHAVEKQTDEKMKKLQELYQILVQNPKVKDYFDKEVRFNVLIADVNKIIGEAIKDVL